MAQGEWGGGDPLADLTAFVEAIREVTGFPCEYREVPGFYCRVCQTEVAAVFPVYEFMGMTRLGEPCCPHCQSTWPLLLNRRRFQCSSSE